MGADNSSGKWIGHGEWMLIEALKSGDHERIAKEILKRAHDDAAEQVGLFAFFLFALAAIAYYMRGGRIG